MTDFDAAPVLELLAVSRNRDLLAAHIHEPWIRYLWRCPRCVAERALLTAAQARLRAMEGT